MYVPFGDFWGSITTTSLVLSFLSTTIDVDGKFSSPTLFTVETLSEI